MIERTLFHIFVNTRIARFVILARDQPLRSADRATAVSVERLRQPDVAGMGTSMPATSLGHE